VPRQSSSDRFGDGFGGEQMWGLQELPYPEPIPFLPQTAGWLVVAVLILLLLGWLGWWLWRRRQANRYRIEALARLRGLAPDDASILPQILRKTALHAYQRSEVASLRGSDWIAWLNRTAGRELFQATDAALFDRLAYRCEELAPAEFQRLHSASRVWVVDHHA
jgi:hypothetical protein